jgi:molybdopterin-synthase adenylyltransferase
MLVTVVGLGALGSNLLFVGRSLDIEWRIIDFDHIEYKNTQSQFHTMMSLGKNKALSLQRTLKSLFKINVADTRPTRLTSDNAKQLLGGADLVIDCLDNAESRHVLANYCRDNGITRLHSALSEDGTVAVIQWDDDFVIAQESEVGAATCEAGENLPMIMASASYLALALQQHVEHGHKRSYQVLPTGAMRT